MTIEAGQAGAHHVRSLPDVSVLVITYNHRPFIAQAIQSVCAQRYPGQIRLIVSDDCSTDGAQDEIKRVKCTGPVTMETVLHEKNGGGFANLESSWRMATGEYVALLEGDDYWADDDKLALQIAALEDNPGATMSFGRSRVIDVTVEPPIIRLSMAPPTGNPTLDDLLVDNFVPTPTVVYRRDVLPEFPSWFAQCLVRDWPLALCHAASGEMIYSERVLAVARVHAGGRWTAMPHGQRVSGSLSLRSTVTNNFGLPRGWTDRMLNARTMVTMALMAEGQTEALRCLSDAARFWPGIVRTRRFWYAAGHSVAGTRAIKTSRWLRSKLQAPGLGRE